MSLRLIVIALLLLSCRVVKESPEAKGNTSVVVYNELAADVCEFSMTPVGASVPSANWLQRAFSNHVTLQLHVKPGAYKVRVGCGMQFHGVADVTIAGPTDIWIGQRVASTSTSAGVVIPVSGRVGLLNSAPAGAAPANPAAGDEPAAEPNQCWPDGHPCEAINDPCCNSCSWDTNRKARVCH